MCILVSTQSCMYSAHAYTCTISNVYIYNVRMYSRYMHVGTWMHVYYIYYGDVSKMYSSTPCLMLCKTEYILTFS